MRAIRPLLRRSIVVSKNAHHKSGSVRNNHTNINLSSDANETYGQLVTDKLDDANVNVEDTETQSLSRVRAHPLTLAAKSEMPNLLSVPKSLSKVVAQFPFDHKPQLLRQRASVIYNELADGGSHRASTDAIDADAQISGLLLHTYTRTFSALSEVKQRMPKDWSPKRVLDVGFGPATGLLVAHEIFDSAGLEKRVAVVLGDKQMRKRAAELLKAQNPETSEDVVIKSKVLSASSPQEFDLIIATDQLYQKAKNCEAIADSHARHLARLLAPEGVLVFTEKGDPIAAEVTARARQVLLRPENSGDSPNREWVPIPGKLGAGRSVGLRVLAPCMHHSSCPLQLGINARIDSSGARSAPWCRFQNRALRPKFVLELKKGKYLAQRWRPAEDERTGALYRRGDGGSTLAGTGRPKGNDNEMVSYTYLAFQASKLSELPLTNSTESRPMNTKAIEPVAKPSTPSPLSAPNCLDEPGAEKKLGRILKTPLKRKGHVNMMICAPSGHIESWTITRQNGLQAYADARRSRQGDLWVLGAKTVQLRGGLAPRHRAAAIKFEASKKKQPYAKLVNITDPWEKSSVATEDEAPKDFADSIANLSEEDIQGAGRIAKHNSKQRSDVHRHW